MIKLKFLVALSVTTLAMPAFAQSVPARPIQRRNVQPIQQPTPPKPFATLLKDKDTVHEGGNKYLGKDPDQQVRSQIMKDEAMHKGNGY